MGPSEEEKRRMSLQEVSYLAIVLCTLVGESGWCWPDLILVAAECVTDTPKPAHLPIPGGTATGSR